MNIYQTALAGIQTDKPEIFDQLIEEHIRLTDIAAIQKAAATAGEQVGYQVNLGVQLPDYHNNLNEIFNAFSFYQSARPSAKLDFQSTAEGTRAQVSFWREIEQGTVIYGGAVHDNPAIAIGLALLMAEQKALDQGIGLPELQKPKEKHVCEHPDRIENKEKA